MKYINPNKYRAVKTELDGIVFDSKREANRYSELKLLLRAGTITELHIQPAFDVAVNGVPICRYIADFRYTALDGKVTVEDVKGMRTPAYRLKKKLVEALYGIRILEL